MTTNLDRDAIDDFQFRYLNLLAERMGGRAIECSDQWFASCDNLVKPGRGVFKEGEFTEKGQWMDGWESRRSFGRQFRPSGLDYDWCVLRLGFAGRIHGVDVDTHHFRGNAPLRIAVDATSVRLDPDPTTVWTEIIPQTDVLPDEQNPIPCHSASRWTHLRLRIYPDGGVARFRAYGEVIPDPEDYVEGEFVDLASVALGGRGVAASDQFYSSTDNLVMPGRGVNMGDGWETRRRRDEHNDWAIIRLGRVGTVRKIILDTAHLRGNFPDRFSLEGCLSPGEPCPPQDAAWTPIMPQHRLCPDREHVFTRELVCPAQQRFSHVRLNIFPDGGVSRLRVFGLPDWGEA
ncbi:MAG: allantoicase [Halieaceae bacterium]|jgi:allantoicase|nr:allantoicase [Halieaceae bacterium]